ncbi:unnamed protein product [Rotaria magnacalcarata]|uniref:EF-hand domain-containing protein n=2 Tax=Rotaria magnacalcarata TaxID=392030 RepID=A0A819QZZ7_9BILA|nr:unnamed protein product [Rotaria magnacalcarata]CAF1651601.1 unnamed protein product [Rotaria magnacalcarata]CAF1931381.1 unnamed protein product [Rotaria magnacalcarata]CAF2077262.1 unnamed protein product [Rotaria magnacalcarata]CAF2223096.1 unnamed protein product [Rotaria magnacalcarata]
MKLKTSIFFFFAVIITIGAPPVVEHPTEDKAKTEPRDPQDSDDVLDNLEYGRYLKEVVEILESDPEFKKKIENASLSDIKSGNIAEHLSLVQHHIRTQLDEAKQREMIRLRELVGQRVRNLSDKQRAALARGDARGKLTREFLPQHVDHKNVETFGQTDLERLIRHASRDLDELDRKREKEFKDYEMQKEYERRAQLAKLNSEERRKLEQMHAEALEKKKHHPKVNHPGSVDQIEQVWEDVDKLDADQFSPKSFFNLHDINTDGFLDEGEIEAIMLKEAEKVHDGTPEADPVEKQEELDRMRQHLLTEFDKNADRMLSLEEFLLGINGTGAKNDQGWQSIEDSTVFSDQDFNKFSEKMAPISTSIPIHQTPSLPNNQQVPIHPEAAVDRPAVGQQQIHIPRAPPAANTA